MLQYLYLLTCCNPVGCVCFSVFAFQHQWNSFLMNKFLHWTLLLSDSQVLFSPAEMSSWCEKLQGTAKQFKTSKLLLSSFTNKMFNFGYFSKNAFSDYQWLHSQWLHSVLVSLTLKNVSAFFTQETSVLKNADWDNQKVTAHLENSFG